GGGVAGVGVGVGVATGVGVAVGATVAVGELLFPVPALADPHAARMRRPAVPPMIASSRFMDSVLVLRSLPPWVYPARWPGSRMDTRAGYAGENLRTPFGESNDRR